ncbi:MAG: AlkZ family DNA glycosylase [Thermoleophilaceae bacterium]|nr:AlkZ family DNA glycosylase [Thermoleophilaceae bacterium]
MTERILGERELNRALLERQSLLERRGDALPRAVERMGGVQAQYAPSIYVGLWSRVAGLGRDQVTRALERRSLVQATLLRNTIHIVTPGDYWQLADATRDSRRGAWLRARAKRGPDRRAVTAAAKRMRRVLAKGPATRAELMPLADGDPSLFNGATIWLDLVRVPPAGTWERRRADIYAFADGWIERAETEHPRRHTITRYLAAFGPAPFESIQSWSGIAPAELRPVIENMELRRFHSEEGTLLLDLPRRSLPDPSAKAPVRFLPVWDAALLVHARHTGILPERFRSLVFSARTPQSVNTFTVDGAVAGTWSEEKGRVKVKSFEPLPRATRREVDDEARRLEGFIS